MKKDFSLTLPDYEDGVCPFKNLENSKYDGIQYLESNR